MKTKANVYLLPADKEPDYPFIAKNMEIGSENLFHIIHGNSENSLDFVPYHIYITLPQFDLEISKIKYGDYWLYNCPINGIDFGDNNKPIIKNTLPNSMKWFDKLHDIKNYEKIIATTDISLKIKKLELDTPISVKPFPTIPQQFIEYYINEYNEGNVIREIDVEIKFKCKNKHFMKNQYVIVRSNMAGVFFGILKERIGAEVTLLKARKIYHWIGANTVEDIAVYGVSGDKITCEVDNMVILDVCQVLPCTQESILKIQNSPVWSQK